MLPLSAVIITFNEEKNIERCLQSLIGVVDDIVVVDSFSTDKTGEICKRYAGVHFLSIKWQGYAATKNLANTYAKYDWILSMDADEALSETLKQSILKLKQRSDYCIGKFNRLTNYCGKWIRHGSWYPDEKIRIFDRRETKWAGTIHEELQLNSQKEIVKLKGDCLHYSYYSIEQHKKKIENFSTLLAKDMFEKGKTITFMKHYLSPFAKFFKMYVLKLGFLDGYYGFVIAYLSAKLVRMKYDKLSALKN